VNLKLSVLVCPEFAWHIIIQFRTVLRQFHYLLLKYFLCAAISRAGCCFEWNHPVKYAVNKQKCPLIHEGDVIHHFKATDLSYVRIVITFISSFTSLLRETHKAVCAIRDCKKKA
jgi:hypothetical protein